MTKINAIFNEMNIINTIFILLNKIKCVCKLINGSIFTQTCALALKRIILVARVYN